MFKSSDKEEDLARLDPRHAPKFSDQHLHVPHADLVRIVRGLSDDDQKIGECVVGLTITGADMAAAFAVADSSVVFQPGIQLWLGVVNSNSRKRASRFYGGVTSNGRGVVFDKLPPFRHTMNLDVRQKARDALDLLSMRAAGYHARAALMDGKDVSEEAADWLAFRAAKKKIVGPGRRTHILSAYRRLLRAHRASAWTLALAFGEAAASSPPITNNPLSDVLSQMHDFAKLVMSNEKSSVESPL